MFSLMVVLFLVVFEGVYEGLADRGLKGIGGVIEFTYRIGVLFMVVSWSCGGSWVGETCGWVNMMVGYVLLRYAVFDAVYNVSCGNPVFFVGSTKYYDRAWRWFFDKTKFPDSTFLLWTKGLCLLIGLSLLLNWV